MSIKDQINHLCSEDPPRLILLKPAMPSEPCLRTMFVIPEIYNLVTGPDWADVQTERRANQLRQDFDRFITGEVIRISLDPIGDPNSTYMARTDPVEHELFDIRSRDPSPGIRVLGSFSDVDTFVALDWSFRKRLGGKESKEWRDFIEGARATWRQLFPTYKPHSGSNVNDYISKYGFSV